jgi:hypothetical protein
MFTDVFLLAQQAKDKEDDTEIGGDQGSLMDSPGEGKGEDSDQRKQNGEDDGDFGHGVL